MQPGMCSRAVAHGKTVAISFALLTTEGPDHHCAAADTSDEINLRAFQQQIADTSTPAGLLPLGLQPGPDPNIWLHGFTRR